VQDLSADGAYDAIVSGLPLNNFSGALVGEILRAMAGLAAPGGTLSFFEYVAVRPARAVISRSAERDRLRAVGRAIDGLLAGQEFQRELVLANLPPAWVHHVRLRGPAATNGK
jgi:phospholipid N-methyltransferase